MTEEAQKQRQLAEQATVASLQSQLSVLQESYQHARSLWADMEQDMVSDEESLAPSEKGESVEAKKKKRADRAAYAAERKRRVCEFCKVMYKRR